MLPSEDSKTETETKFTIKIDPPSWGTVVNMVDRFSVDAPNRAAIAPLLDELRRIARIADGDDPDVIMVARR